MRMNRKLLRFLMPVIVFLFFAGLLYAGSIYNWTALNASPALDDLIGITDISDSTQSATGTSKKITVAELLQAQNASNVSIDTTNLDNNLSSSDSDLQTLVETVDEMTTGSGEDLSDNNINDLANSTSAQFAEVITDETGTGVVVFNTDPTLTGFTLGGDITASSAYDFDLDDNVASAFSFDAAGKAGILSIDTRDGQEEVDMSGDLDVAGGIEGATFTADRSTTPSAVFRDSDTTDSDDNAKISAQCTATGSGAEDCDVKVYQQRGGAETLVTLWDADGGPQVRQFVGADAMSDDKYGGTEILYGRNAGESISQWDLVFFNSADNEWHQADANAAGEFPTRGVAVACSDDTWPCNDGDGLEVMTRGVVRNDGWSFGTVGGTIFLSETAGGMTQTAPSDSGDAVQVVGWALSDDEAYVNIAGHWLEVE